MGNIFEVYLNGRKIETTREHPFHVFDRDWTPAGELNIGDRVLGLTNTQTTVSDLKATSRIEPVFNIRVPVTHTYFVGREDWGFDAWTHNVYTPPGEDPTQFLTFTLADGTKITLDRALFYRPHRRSFNQLEGELRTEQDRELWLSYAGMFGLEPDVMDALNSTYLTTDQWTQLLFAMRDFRLEVRQIYENRLKREIEIAERYARKIEWLYRSDDLVLEGNVRNLKEVAFREAKKRLLENWEKDRERMVLRSDGSYGTFIVRGKPSENVLDASVVKVFAPSAQSPSGWVEIPREEFADYTEEELNRYLARFAQEEFESILYNEKLSDGNLAEAYLDVLYVQEALDLVGLVPFVGEPADLVNGTIYAIRGRYTEAALSALALLPLLGSAATGAKYVAKVDGAECVNEFETTYF